MIKKLSMLNGSMLYNPLSKNNYIEVLNFSDVYF